MERLTEKVNDYWRTNDKAHIYYLDTNENVFVGNAIDRLAEFEDVLEKYGVESAEELDKLIHYKDCQIDRWEQDYENCSKLVKSISKEHQYCLDNWRTCEQELAELKQKAIMPKFNVGDYFIEYWDAEPSIYRYKGNNHFECLNKIQGYHCDYIVLGALLLGENFIKKISKEEAMLKLADMMKIMGMKSNREHQSMRNYKKNISNLEAKLKR